MRYIVDIVDIDAWYHAWMSSVRAMARWASTTRQGAEIFGADTPTGDRLHTTSQLLEHLGHDMTLAAEHRRQTLTTQRKA